MLKTKELEHILTQHALNDLFKVKNLIDFEPTVIADIGANIGYYAHALLKVFHSAKIHCYEPHPDNLHYLQQINNPRLTIHTYGLYEADTIVNIGMRDNNNNNGTYSIYNHTNLTSVQFKNANLETIRPDFIKMDIEGSEIFVLKCEDFLSNVRAILIEMVYLDDFNQNTQLANRLLELGFNKKIQISKNDYLWLR